MVVCYEYVCLTFLVIIYFFNKHILQHILFFSKDPVTLAKIIIVLIVLGLQEKVGVAIIDTRQTKC